MLRARETSASGSGEVYVNGGIEERVRGAAALARPGVLSSWELLRQTSHTLAATGSVCAAGNYTRVTTPPRRGVQTPPYPAAVDVIAAAGRPPSRGSPPPPRRARPRGRRLATIAFTRATAASSSSASSAASASAAAPGSSSTRSTRPIASASSASIRRPVRQRSSARLRPTSVGRPHAATASPWPGPRACSHAPGAAIRRSQRDRELQAAADRGPVERGQHRARQLEDAGVERDRAHRSPPRARRRRSTCRRRRRTARAPTSRARSRARRSASTAACSASTSARSSALWRSGRSSRSRATPGARVVDEQGHGRRSLGSGRRRRGYSLGL